MKKLPVNSHAYDLAKRTYPHEYTIKRRLRTDMASTAAYGEITRTTLTVWFKNNGITTHKTFGTAGDVLIDRNWRVFSFRNGEHAALFRLTWGELFI